MKPSFAAQPPYYGSNPTSHATAVITKTTPPHKHPSQTTNVAVRPGPRSPVPSPGRRAVSDQGAEPIDVSCCTMAVVLFGRIGRDGLCTWMRHVSGAVGGSWRRCVVGIWHSRRLVPYRASQMVRHSAVSVTRVIMS